MRLVDLMGCTTVLLAAVAAVAQPRGPLPQADVWPRTRPEWEALAKVREQSGAFRDAYPDYAAEWDAAWDSMTAIGQKYVEGTPITLDEMLAKQLIDELYVDRGHPILNNAVQDFILDTIIRQIERWPDDRFPDAARKCLVAGLVEYARQGGGQYNPMMQARFLRLLARLGYDDPDAQQMADRLLTDALEWATAVGDEDHLDVVRRAAQRQWPDTWELRLYEIEVRSVLPAGPKPRAYETAVSALAALLTDTPRTGAELARAVRSATELACCDLTDAALRDDLTCRLLIALRGLLARRPEVPEQVSYYIDRQLLRLAVKETRLKTERHWRLWVEAVKELGPERISSTLKKRVRALLTDKDLPSERRVVLETLRPLAELQASGATGTGEGAGRPRGPAQERPARRQPNVAP